VVLAAMTRLPPRSFALYIALSAAVTKDLRRFHRRLPRRDPDPTPTGIARLRGSAIAACSFRRARR
jgi:hypothetical protein